MKNVALINTLDQAVEDMMAPKVVATTSSQLIALHGGTKSSAIRALLATGMQRKDVAKALNIRYQHVRNVQITPIKKAK